ncbi:hypothetical protein N864_10990 [Intrasporangium chromatireducens Q5-1]|uniref:DUF72 domain-containing protein n=1 Tax=Intrasporangium chromatireducens Q5-1 TaxID=584657 RepID=W9GQ30_9MICO|nr:DUF72 domain-containing protein [Intrasporangium chromatireducens]EWT07147.1 hypothetical protein N864_10990 [Intrasporangium chromatireducens Q5-1]
MSRCWVGVSGWRYPRWRGDFYPTGLRQRDELTYTSERMPSVEINGSFYSLQRPTSYASWAAATPADFVFAVKGGRFITHLKQLHDVDAPLANFFASGVLALGRKLGPVLWQLPARMPLSPERLDRFFTLLPRTHAEAAALAAQHDGKLAEDRVLTDLAADVRPDTPIRHALEPRHPSFETAEARAILAEHGICMVVADSAGVWPTMPDATSNFRYVRLHGETELYASGYTDASLDRWAEQCRAWLADGHDTYVYFDNDAKGHAPFDAVRLLDRLR